MYTPCGHPDLFSLEWDTGCPGFHLSPGGKRGGAIADETDNPLTPELVAHSSSEKLAVERKTNNHREVLQGDCHLPKRKVETVYLRPLTIQRAVRVVWFTTGGTHLNCRTNGRRLALSK